MTLINSSLRNNYNYQKVLIDNSKKTPSETKTDRLEKLSAETNTTTTETYNPISGDNTPGKCYIPVGTVVKGLGKFAFRAAGGWIGIGIGVGCTLYAHYGEGKGWGQSLKEGFLW